MLFVSDYRELPRLIEMKEIKREEFSPPDPKQIEENLQKLIRSFIEILLPFVSFPFFSFRFDSILSRFLDNYSAKID